MQPKTIALQVLVDYLDNLLGASEGEDYGPNGLQVAGPTEVGKIITGVSACQELFLRARAAQAQAILVHHGILWAGAPQALIGSHFKRVSALIEGGLGLLAYHLPLDRHPDLGNNSLAARSLGLTNLDTFAPHKGLDIGFKGSFETPVSLDALVSACTSLFGQEPLVIAGGPESIRTAGVISGAGQDALHEAIKQGLDVFITGEASEWVMNVAVESGIHYIAAGHYATERLGIRALGDHLRDHFGIDVEFVDIPNPV
jgi:dinuclear metal center YbgI/SA1388 family protein